MANIVDAEDFVRKATVIEDDGEKTEEFSSLDEQAEAPSAEEEPEVTEAKVLVTSNGCTKS